LEGFDAIPVASSDFTSSSTISCSISRCIGSTSRLPIYWSRSLRRRRSRPSERRCFAAIS
jgi:hypothetical protein